MMRALIFCFDGWLRKTLGVFEYCDASDCLLRVRLSSAAHPLYLPDCIVVEGAPVLELHLWNEHIPPLPPEGPDLAWAAQTQRRLVASFRALADRMRRDPNYAAIQAVGGVTVLILPGNVAGGEKLFQRLGFSMHPYHSTLGRFGEFWENFYSWWIMWAFNPPTLRRRRLTRLRRAEIWMCVEEFLRRYCANEMENHGC
jgi:hypothetical protein